MIFTAKTEAVAKFSNTTHRGLALSDIFLHLHVLNQEKKIIQEFEVENKF